MARAAPLRTPALATPSDGLPLSGEQLLAGERLPGPGRTGPHHARLRLGSWLFAILVASAGALYFLVSDMRLVLSLYPLFGLSAAAVIFWGTDRHKPWLLIGLGTVLFSLGDAVYNLYDGAGSVPFPSYADTAYLSGYLLIAAGILALMPAQRGRSRILGVLDTTIITVAVGSYLWLFAVVPAARASGSSLLTELVGGAYPVMDLLLLAFLVRLLFSGAVPSPSLRLLGIGFAFLLVTDTVFYGYCQPHGIYLNHSYPDFGWVVSYAFFGLAALHPSAREELQAADFDRVGRLRLTSLAAALLSGPVVLFLELHHAYNRTYAYELSAPLAILILLVFGRMAFGIRDQQEMVAEVGHSERHFRALIEHASDAISVIDKDGVYVYQSPSVKQVFGYEPEERLGRSIYDYVAPADRPRMRALMESICEGQIIPSVTVKALHKDGHVLTLDCSISVRLADPDVRGIIINTHDVTQRTELESQLAQAQKMEAVGQLAGGVAHDFNNILQAISGYAELALLDVADITEVEDALGEIHDSSRRGAALSRQLLDFSRGTADERPQPLDVGAVVLNVQRLLERLIGEQVEIVVEVPTGLGLVVVDPSRLEQVIVNMAVNARDAMEGGGRLEISLREAPASVLARRPELEPGCYLELVFSDQGHGMDEGTIARIFDPFYTTKEVGQGTGLGLATSYSIVRRVGGAIDVESEVGVGTTFRVLLPVAAETDEELGGQIASAGTPAATEVGGPDALPLSASLPLSPSPTLAAALASGAAGPLRSEAGPIRH